MVVERRQSCGNLESYYRRCAATQAISQPAASHGRNTTHHSTGIGSCRIRLEHQSSDIFKWQLTTPGTERAVEVIAESLYEAVAQALGILRGDTWVEEIGEGLTELKVRVKQPAVGHRVRMKGFRRWLESQGRTPAECTRKRKLLALAKGEGQEL